MEAADAAPVEEMSYLQMEPAGDGDSVEASYLEMTPDAVIEEGDDVGAYLEMAAVSVILFDSLKGTRPNRLALAP